MGIPLVCRLNAPALFCLGLTVLQCFLGATPVDEPVRHARSGRQIYMSACSACHGADGRGAGIHRVGFDTPLPDFTDCNFTTREPWADWVAIAHDGGPTRGFSQLMPAFGEALSMEDLELATGQLKSFCTDDAWPDGDLNLPRTLFTEKAFPEDEAVFTSSLAAEGHGKVANKIVYEKRFGARNQFEMVIPFTWAEDVAQGDWDGGLGDIAVGAKRVFFHSRESGTIFSATGEVKLPTGDSDKGFGSGTTIVEPFVSFGQILPSDSFFQAQAGFEFPTDRDLAENEAFWRLAFGRTFSSGRFGRAWSPMAEFLAARELVTGERISWDIVPQMQVTLNTRQHIMLNVGVRIPLTDADVRDTQIAFYLLWDWFDGGFLEGW